MKASITEERWWRTKQQIPYSTEIEMSSESIVCVCVGLIYSGHRSAPFVTVWVHQPGLLYCAATTVRCCTVDV